MQQAAAEQPAASAALKAQAHRVFLPLVPNASGSEPAYSVDAMLTVDVVAPSEVPLTLTADGLTVEPGGIVRTASPVLRLSWEASQDGSGLDDYTVRWLAASAVTTTETTRVHAPGGPFEDFYQAGEGAFAGGTADCGRTGEPRQDR